MVSGKPWLDLMQDILGQLELPGLKGLCRASKARAVAVPAGLVLSIPGESCLLFRLAALLVGAGDLEGKLSVVAFQSTNPGGDSANQPACHRGDKRQ